MCAAGSGGHDRNRGLQFCGADQRRPEGGGAVDGPNDGGARAMGSTEGAWWSAVKDAGHLACGEPVPFRNERQDFVLGDGQSTCTTANAPRHWWTGAISVAGRAQNAGGGR